MKHCSLPGLFAGLLFLVLPMSGQADPGRPLRNFSDYLYLSVHEVTSLNEVIWFWSPDSMDGPVHSNDFIGIRYNPVFFDTVTTSKPNFIEYQSAPVFEDHLYRNWPEVVMPSALDGLRDAADVHIENPGDTLQFRLIGNEDGWSWKAWPASQPFSSDVVVDEGDISYAPGDGHVIFFEGRLELKGVVADRVTIGARGDIYLTDNLRVVDSNPVTGFVPDTSPYYIGVASEGGIYVADTPPNGEGNGAAEGGGPDRQDIVITASMLTIGGSFTIEHQNNSGDDYIWCDPNGSFPGSPDERGTIYLYGSLAQFRHGYVHRSTCGGTGYDKTYHYDRRLRGNPPPHFPDIVWEPGTVDREITLQDTTLHFDGTSMQILPWGHLTIGPNVHIFLDSDVENPMIWSRGEGVLHVEGTPGQPVRITLSDDLLCTPWVYSSDMQHPQSATSDTLWSDFEIDGPRYQLQMPERTKRASLSVTYNAFLWAPVDDGMEYTVDSCSFTGNFICQYDPFANSATLSHSLVKGQLVSRFDDIDRCTFVARDEADSVAISNQRLSAHVLNTFFYGSYRGAIHSDMASTVDYSGFYELDTPVPFGRGVSVGQHMLPGGDPLFVDAENGDFHLQEGSPLIDAGDPDSPPDADGSVADIGAFAVTQEQDSPPLERNQPFYFALDAPHPNPFNSATTVRFTLPGERSIRLSVVNLLGREVAVLRNGRMGAGEHRVSMNLEGQASGIYFLRLDAGNRHAVRKLVYVR